MASDIPIDVSGRKVEEGMVLSSRSSLDLMSRVGRLCLHGFELAIVQIKVGSMSPANMVCPNTSNSTRFLYSPVQIVATGLILVQLGGDCPINSIVNCSSCFGS